MNVARMTMNVCKVCASAALQAPLSVAEMLNGSREKFSYSQCAQCSSLQLMDPPADLSAYYQNATYGSFSPIPRSWLKIAMRRLRNQYAVRGLGGPLGYLLNKLNPVPADFTIINRFAGSDSTILDVGCGMGAYIADLRDIGFKHANGIDPYLASEVRHPNGATVRRCTLTELTEKYDVIVSHHSFEHVDDPLRDLGHIRRSLNPGGVCILTVPVAEDLFRRYREHCYLIQAPQHFFLYSIKGMLALAQRAGFEVQEVIRDASNAVDWMSVSALWSEGKARNEVAGDLGAYLGAARMKEFQACQDQLRREGQGDNVTFILRPRGDADAN
jgi:SAM-dependent methyltransferase